MNRKTFIYNLITLLIAIIVSICLIKVVLAADKNPLIVIPFQSDQLCQSEHMLKFSLNKENAELLKQLSKKLLNKPIFTLVNDKLKTIAITDEKNAQVLINQDYHVVNVATVRNELEGNFVVPTYKNIVMVKPCSKE
ncbi:MAG: hypothetical protein EP298_13210 [Gammaproteobacteria bacterium]|nr:MAG: hypothetical protein EP298_13210 [Gammaproteobacteria bacterium]UTW41763.1 hypothetical protein KFE69_09625 [bacterium SCSIO 12844]